MRILIVNSLYQTPRHPRLVGGAENSVRLLAESLASRGHVTSVIRALPPWSLPTDELVSGVRVFGVPSKNIYWPYSVEPSPRILRPIWHAIEDSGTINPLLLHHLDEFQPDVVHTNTLAGLTTGIWQRAKERGVRVVHTLRDYYLLCPSATLFKNGAPCERQCNSCAIFTRRRRQATSYVDAVVGNSQFTLGAHINNGLFSASKIKTNIGSVVAAADARKLNSKRNGVITFGFIGRVTYEKGVHLLAEAFGKMPDGSSRLVIAGETDKSIQERLHSVSCGKAIDFIGFVQPADFYRQVDVVVAPSIWHDPLPRSVLDAVAWGVPVIGSNRGGTEEAMGAPPFGWVFNPDAPEQLAAIMRTIVDAGIVPTFPKPIEKPDPVEQYLAVYKG